MEDLRELLERKKSELRNLRALVRSKSMGWGTARHECKETLKPAIRRLKSMIRLKDQGRPVPEYSELPTKSEMAQRVYELKMERLKLAWGGREYFWEVGPGYPFGPYYTDRVVGECPHCGKMIDGTLKVCPVCKEEIENTYIKGQHPEPFLIYADPEVVENVCDAISVLLGR